MLRDHHTPSSGHSRLSLAAASCLRGVTRSVAGRSVIVSFAPILVATSAVHADAPVCVGEIACEYVATPCLPLSGFSLEAINDSGLGVGSTTSLNPQPCIWTAEGGVMPLPKPQGVSGGQAVAVNNNNWILVNANGTPQVRGYVLIPSSPMEWTWIPIVPNSGSLGWSWVMDINDSNMVAGYGSYGTETSYLHPYRGFSWSIETGRVDIPIGDWNASEFTGINEAGLICGRVANASVADLGVNGVRAAVFADGAMTIIEPPAGFDRTSAQAINDAGLVAVNTINWSTGHQLGMLFDPVSGSITQIPAPEGFWRWWINDLGNSGIAGGVGELDVWQHYQRPVIACADGGVDLLDRMAIVAGTTAVLQMRDDGSMLISVVSGPPGVKGNHIVHAASGSADLDCNAIIDGSDLGVMLSSWGQTGIADLTGDGVVDGADLGVLLSAWSR